MREAKNVDNKGKQNSQQEKIETEILSEQEGKERGSRGEEENEELKSHEGGEVGNELRDLVSWYRYYM